MTLDEFFAEHPKVALAFSGGVDSSYLLHAACASGADVRPYFVNTALQPPFELEDARAFAKEEGVELTVIEHDILRNADVAANGSDRCYHCKTALLGLMAQQAHRDGYELLLDGTNASDDADERPGMRALGELGVCSPLRDCGLSKADIRARSKEAGLPTWGSPSYTCLATRIPTGKPLCVEDLARVEGAEGALFALGYSDLRVRLFNGAARLQLPADQLVRAACEHERIEDALAPWFDAVLLDLRPRP